MGPARRGGRHIGWVRFLRRKRRQLRPRPPTAAAAAAEKGKNPQCACFLPVMKNPHAWSRFEKATGIKVNLKIMTAPMMK